MQRKIYNTMIFATVAFATAANSIIPKPLEIEETEGYYDIPLEIKIETEGIAFSDVLDITAICGGEGEYIAKRDGEAPDMKVFVNSGVAESMGAEGYILIVDDRGVRIEASSRQGVLYGMYTICQLQEEREGEAGYRLPYVRIKDYPRFEHRGVMLDVSRHFLTIEEIKKQLRALSRFKINTVHLHLTDAAGWRIEIMVYPRLTGYGAWRTRADWEEWWTEDRGYLPEGSAGAYGGYYTAEELRDLVGYASARGITLIPEIEMPGHGEEAVAAYPELGCDHMHGVTGDLCPGKETTYAFLTGVLDEVMDIFPSKYIHIGGDEAGMGGWTDCEHCKSRALAEGLDDTRKLQNYLIGRITDYLAAHGREAIAWDEVLENKDSVSYSRPGVIMSWRGIDGGIEAVKSGKRAIMTPGEYCYLNRYQDAPIYQPKAMGGYIPLEKVYGYDPEPDALKDSISRGIMGLQGNLWAEYLPDVDMLEYFMYPRVLAIAERGWSREDVRDFEDFRRRALMANDNLQSQGYNCFDMHREVGPRAESKEAIAHLGRGCEVIYNAPWHPAYAASGATTLTDGERGDWTYTDGRWQGFISRDRLDVTIDLGEEKDISEVYADFMQSVSVEIYLPVKTEILLSSDGETYTTVYNSESELDLASRVSFARAQWEGKRKARYIRMRANSSRAHGGWVFTDEIVIN